MTMAPGAGRPVTPSVATKDKSTAAPHLKVADTEQHHTKQKANKNEQTPLEEIRRVRADTGRRAIGWRAPPHEGRQRSSRLLLGCGRLVTARVAVGARLRHLLRREHGAVRVGAVDNGDPVLRPGVLRQELV